MWLKISTEKLDHYNLFIFAIWHVFLGINHEQDLGNEGLEAILKSDLTSEQKFAQYEQLIEKLTEDENAM